MTRTLARGAALVNLSISFVAAMSAAASARDFARYGVTGRDELSIGAGEIHSKITYRGTQSLRVVAEPHGAQRYRSHASYVRDDGTDATHAAADYVADVNAAGDLVASADRDPDYLTVLNQPFAARLDATTLADLGHLRGALPFDFPSPFTASSLHGYLQHLHGGTIGGKRTLAVRFEAAGPMRGALPDRPGLALVGTIAMRGTANYDVATALLLALETTVTVSGNVTNRTGNDPVTIVYVRSIRALR